MSMAKADALFAQGMWPEAAQLRQEALADDALGPAPVGGGNHRS